MLSSQAIWLTDLVVTNDLAPTSSEAIQQASSFRWTVKQLHRGGQALKGRFSRNRIGCEFISGLGSTQ